MVKVDGPMTGGYLMDSDLRSSARAICDQIILWQAPSGGVSTEIRRYHRPPYLRKAISSGQDIPWLVRALYAFYDLTCEPRYKEAADRYAIFFMSCTLDRSHAWQIGGALEPCFTLYREHNPGDESLDPSAHALYRWLVGYRTDDGNYFNAGYGWRDAENVRHDEEDVGYSDDLSDVGRGLVAYYRLFKDAEALKHAIGLAKYFVREHRPGTMEGVWSGKAGTWLIGPRHNGGFENLFVSADEAGWGWSSYYCSLYLARLYDCLSDDEQKGIIRDRCVTSLKWMFDACQFDDGAVGMHQRDDKWLEHRSSIPKSPKFGLGRSESSGPIG